MRLPGFGPLVAVEDPQHDHGIVQMNVFHYVRMSRDRKLARPLDPAGPSHPRMLGERASLLNQLKDGIVRGARVVAAKVCLDRFQIAGSLLRPL